jgi:hypothetical protein
MLDVLKLAHPPEKRPSRVRVSALRARLSATTIPRLVLGSLEASLTPDPGVQPTL